MIDFKKALTSFYSAIKWYYLVFILAIACLSIFSDLMSALSIILILIFGTAIFGIKTFGKLNNPKTSGVPILKNSGIYTLTTIIFLILQYLFIIIGILPFYIITKNLAIFSNPVDLEVFFYTTPGWQIIIAMSVFLIFLIGVFILELLKIIGIIKYFKTNKFKEIFTIKNNLILIFSKDYLTILIFLIGTIIICLFLLFALFSIFGIFESGLLNSVFGILLIITIYIINITHYSLISDLIYNKK